MVTQRIAPATIERAAMHGGAAPDALGWPRADAETSRWRKIRAWLPATQEPVPHGRVLRWMAIARLPGWAVAVILWGAGWAPTGERWAPRPRAFPLSTDPGLAHALSVWWLWLVPLSLPLVYLLGGFVAHLSLALTGGARRAVGASACAVALAALPSLFLIGALDVWLYTGRLSPEVWAACVVAALVVHAALATVTVALTHDLRWWRSVAVAMPAVVVLAVFPGLRASLELARLPGAPERPEGTLAPRLLDAGEVGPPLPLEVDWSLEGETSVRVHERSPNPRAAGSVTRLAPPTQPLTSQSVPT